MLQIPRSPARKLRLAAIFVLVVGWLVAAVVYAAAMRNPGDTQAVLQDQSTLDQEMYQVERIGGKAAVRTLEFNRWLQSLWHGERLAYALAVLSAVLALLAWHIADLIGDDERATTLDHD